MSDLYPWMGDRGVRLMVFVDGENLAIRFGAMLKERAMKPHPDVVYEPDVLVWSPELSGRGDNGYPGGHIQVIRRHYYTSLQGDDPKLKKIERMLKDVGIEAPRAFQKRKGERRKRVDVSLATDMLLHAARKHYEVAVLVTGDEDFVPLVEAVQGEGAIVWLWSIQNGTSKKLQHAVDRCIDITEYLAIEPQEVA